MNKPKAFFVVSNYNNDISWIKDYTGDYIIYDKSNTLEESEKVLKVENVGYNIYDISHYIINNYHNLPDYVAFLEGNPFDHCKKETFDKIIYNEKFTPIEDYSDVPESYAHTKDSEGHVIERALYYIFTNTWKERKEEKWL